MLAYTLGQRAKEIAIRMALGATAAAGLLFAFVVMKTVSGVVRLDNVSVVDAGALIAGATVVAAAVALASYGPARRATRVDRSSMLRSDG